MDNTIVKNITSQGIDKTAIKNFAVYARNKLIKDIKNKAAMIGVTENGIQEPLSTSTGNIQLFDIGVQEPYRIEGKAIEQRNGFTRELKKRAEGSTYKTAYETLIEEVAYTWFNRIIAIRFMEVNNYMPDRMRVLSSGVEGINEPEFITHVFETSFQFSEEEKNQIIELKTLSSNLAMDELFQYLFIKQCNALNANLPELFEKTNDYTELLLTVSYNDVEGVIYKLIHDVPEANFDVNSENGNGQVEIIGWLYQYYNTERKDEVINIFGKNVIKKKDIPAATQLFTTDWVVRYMVDNSLGKYWLERNPHSDLIHSLKYLVSKDIEEVDEKISPEDIKFLDNCMGSGHILVYAFDVLMKIYESEGYTTREAARLIVEKNLYGMEIDKRSYQLSYFAIMMKARQYNRKILNEDLQNNLYVFQDSTSINQDHLQYLGNHLSNDERKQAKNQLNYLIELFKNAEELGSIIIVEEDFNSELLQRFIGDYVNQGQISFETIGIDETQQKLINLVKSAYLLKEKYEVIVTNPPYLNKMDKGLKKYVKAKYKGYSKDLFSVFIYRNVQMCKEGGYSAYMAPNVWMFIKNYQQLREYIIENKTIDSLIQMAKGSFYKEATVDVMTFVLKNKIINKTGNYIRLEEFKGGMELQERMTLEAINNSDCNYIYRMNQLDFSKISGSPIAYWASESLLEDFEKGTPMDELVDPKVGLQTGSNDTFLRYWYEVDINKINFNATSIEDSINSGKKWFPYNKGGARRQWYGNYDYVVNWENNGEEIRNFKDDKGKVRSRPQNTNSYFRESLTWSDITSGGFSIRYREKGSIHDVTGMSAFSSNPNQLKYLLGLLSTKISDYIFNIINPTIHLQIGNFSSFPVLQIEHKKIIEIVDQCIEVAKEEWNSYEQSWGYSKHPFLENRDTTASMQHAYLEWEELCDSRIHTVKNNEEILNEIFIATYGLENELTPTVDEKYITLRAANKKNNIKSFISYTVGCMFGRYSLNGDGLAYAGGEFEWSQYTNFQPTKDNVILITDEGYFLDDIVTRFVEFLRVVYGNETLEENLSFIANALVNKGNSSRDVIRNYFLKDFFNDHCKTYQKRPIYWLYDSGKQNGFKAIVYMHRYDEDTTGKVRVEYLHQVQRAYERTIANLQEDIANSNDAKETSQLQKRLEKVTKQLKECRDYDERLGHMALERVAIDLDDGVKVNYEKVQTDSEGKFHQILAKIK